MQLLQHFTSESAFQARQKQESFNKYDKRALSWSVKGLWVKSPRGGELRSLYVCLRIAKISFSYTTTQGLSRSLRLSVIAWKKKSVRVTMHVCGRLKWGTQPGRVHQWASKEVPPPQSLWGRNTTWSRRGTVQVADKLTHSGSLCLLHNSNTGLTPLHMYNMRGHSSSYVCIIPDLLHTNHLFS